MRPPADLAAFSGYVAGVASIAYGAGQSVTMPDDTSWRRLRRPDGTWSDWHCVEHRPAVGCRLFTFGRPR